LDQCLIQIKEPINSHPRISGTRTPPGTFVSQIEVDEFEAEADEMALLVQVAEIDLVLAKLHAKRVAKHIEICNIRLKKRKRALSSVLFSPKKKVRPLENCVSSFLAPNPREHDQ
jgi:hypothetical protein